MQVPLRQVGPSGKVPASTGNFYTGEALGAPGRETGRLLSDAVRGVAGVAGIRADRNDNIALAHAKATLSDQMTKYLVEQSQQPSVDDNGIPKPIDLDEITAGVDTAMESWQGLTGDMSQPARDTLDAWLAGRRETLVNQVMGQREQVRAQFYKKQGPQKIFNLFRAGKELDGTRFLEAYKDSYPEDTDYADRQASEGHFWGIVENLGADAAKQFLRTRPPGLEPERRAQLVEAAERYEKNFEEWSAQNSLVQQRQAARSVLDLIDADSPDVQVTLAQEDSLKNLTEKIDEKAVVVGQDTLAVWAANRNQVVETDYGSKLDLMGQVLNAKPENEWELRMRLAEARYGDKGKLSQQDYESVKAFLAKGYQSHEAGALVAGYDAIRAKRDVASGYGGFGGWAGPVPLSYRDQAEQFDRLVSWFDARREQNNVPDPIETVTYAKKLAAVGTGVAGALGNLWGGRPEGPMAPEEVTAKFGKANKGKSLDDAGVPGDLRKLIEAARAAGLSDDEIMDSDEWRAFATEGK